jgi:hypothetical protein
LQVSQSNYFKKSVLIYLNLRWSGIGKMDFIHILILNAPNTFTIAPMGWLIFTLVFFFLNLNSKFFN